MAARGEWDGYRVSACLKDSNATIRTRDQHNWTRRFPAIAALPIREAVIDGEAVVLDEHGRSNVGLLQQALGTGGRGPGKRTAREAVLYCSDPLDLDWLDLRPRALENRRDALLGTLGEATPVLLFSQAFESVADLFAAAQENELEGAVSKRKDLPYTSRRREDWLNDTIGKSTPAVVGLNIQGARWSAPKLPVDVNYRATTREGCCGHASFKGVRED